MQLKSESSMILQLRVATQRSVRPGFHDSAESKKAITRGSVWRRLGE